MLDLHILIYFYDLFLLVVFLLFGLFFDVLVFCLGLVLVLFFERRKSLQAKFC